MLQFAIMLRVTVYAIFIQVALASPNHDDTAKRRSEEILRAVAAAATADFEGLRQMQAQKVATKTKIADTEATKNCVDDLRKVLDAEAVQLLASAGAASGVATGHENDYKTAQENLKRVLHNALQDIFASIHARYAQIEKHALAMMTALELEIVERGKGIGDNHKHHTDTDAASTIYAQIQEKLGGGQWDEEEVREALNDVLMANAETSAFNSLTGKEPFRCVTRNVCERNEDRSTWMVDSGTGLDNCNNYGRKASELACSKLKYTASGRCQENGMGNVFNEPWPKAPGPGCVAESDMSLADHTQAKNDLIQLTTLIAQSQSGKWNTKEQPQIDAIKDQWAKLIGAQEGKSAKEVEEGAYTAAKWKTDAHKAVVDTSYSEITTYLLKLSQLDADETKKIADLQEEFESLAADWLQLAIYHCCDIVQGNAVECGDAVDHLIKPIDAVFAGALKKPDVKKDCGRRLL